jgi:hypothetical protein
MAAMSIDEDRSRRADHGLSLSAPAPALYTPCEAFRRA